MSETQETSNDCPSSNKGRSGGLTLIEPILGATTVLVIGLTVRSYGWQSIFNGLKIGVGFVTFILLWNRAFRTAPGITKTITVLGVVGLLLLSTAPIWFYQAQTEARKAGVKWRFAEEGRKLQYDIYLTPPSRHEKLMPFPDSSDPDVDE